MGGGYYRVNILYEWYVRVKLTVGVVVITG